MHPRMAARLIQFPPPAAPPPLFWVSAAALVTALAIPRLAVAILLLMVAGLVIARLTGSRWP